MRGTIIRRGKAWLLKFDKATADGKRKFHYTTVRGSRQDAERELTRLLAEADKGALPDVTKASLGSYLRRLARQRTHAVVKDAREIR